MKPGVKFESKQIFTYLLKDSEKNSEFKRVQWFLLAEGEIYKNVVLNQWFSTFFSWRYTKYQKKFWRHTYTLKLENIEKYLEIILLLQIPSIYLFIFHKRISKKNVAHWERSHGTPVEKRWTKHVPNGQWLPVLVPLLQNRLRDVPDYYRKT